MPLTLSIRFLTGRAHLHHWQAHHSDGKVDWPPAPWRLLRALVAVAGRGLTTLPDPDYVHAPGQEPGARKRSPAPVWPGDGYDSLPDRWVGADVPADEISISRLAGLLAALSPAPEFWLPKTSGGHTRQFFPVHEGGIVKNSGSAVFDTFAVVSKDQPIIFHWPDIEWADEDQRMTDLRRLLSRLTYFGRAESWCQAEAELASPQHVRPDETHWRCICIEDHGKPVGREHHDYTLERKLVPLPLSGENQPDLASELLSLFPRTKGISPSRPKKPDEFKLLLERGSADGMLLRCLLRESGQDMRDGLERPIGSRWVHYAVPRDIYQLPRAARPRPAPRPELVQVIRYALNTASAHRPVLPALTDTLLVADKLRRAAMALHGTASRNLSGHEPDGTPCTEHDHAFYWPTDEDNDGFIDHVTVYCPRGFDHDEANALRRLVRLPQRGGRPDLLVTPVYSGSLDKFRQWAPGQDEIGQHVNTKVFVSVTPFVCPVHLGHGRGGGRSRSIVPVMIKGMKQQGLINHDEDLVSIQEIVFDYAPDELRETQARLVARQIIEPMPPSQYFPVIDPPRTFPPLAMPSMRSDRRYSGAFLKEPDSEVAIGLSSGLLVNNGTRFIRSLSFCRNRHGHQAKGYGRMFRIEFAQPRRTRPFAIGDQCHFGLGLFVPADPSLDQDDHP